MSKGPGGLTVTVNCMIIAGFPGIGKTSTYKEMKTSFIGARVVDMDVRDYGTTNGINVADPAAYVEKMKAYSTDNALILCTCDPEVRAKMREAGLFYIVISPEFPPQMANMIPNYVPDPTARAAYMKRFSDHLGANVLAGQTLDGKGYEDAIIELFNDPMPHLVAPFLNKEIVSQSWELIERMTRQVISPGALVDMGVQRPDISVMNEVGKMFPDGKLPDFLMRQGFNFNGQQLKGYDGK